jgi:hypothetical protein
MSDDIDPMESDQRYENILRQHGHFENEVRSISLIPPAPPSGSCDAWGNIRGEPDGTAEERHGEDSVKITVHYTDGRWFYGYQIKIGTMIKQKAANVKDHPFSSADFARSAASIEVERVCNTNKNVKRIFAEFIRIRYNQGSLFEGVNNE